MADGNTSSAATTTGPSLVSMSQQFSGLPMQDLIGTPLMAAADANQKMGLTQVKFLLETGFEPDTTSGNYVPIMIKMQLTRQILNPGVVAPDGTQMTPPAVTPETTTFDLPLLTILPLNSLGVDDVLVKFNMEVKSSYSQKSKQSTDQKSAASGTFKGSANWGLFSVSVSGSVSYSNENRTSQDSQYQKSNSAQYSVSVHAGQLPLPDGVKTIITAFTNSISPITLPETVTPSSKQ